MSAMKCVVTGAGGFIGWHLANGLAADGWRVVGVDQHFPDGYDPIGHARFEEVLGDFRDGSLMEDALQGASALFHLASAHLQVNLPESEYWDVNVHSVPALLERAKEAGVKRCIHTSSVGVYGDVMKRAANEETPPKPQGIYGRTKLAGEEAALRFSRENDFEVVVLRPAWVYGPGCPRTLKIYRALRKRRFLMIGRCRNLRHPIFIDDMVQAYRLAESEPYAVGQVFNIAGERPVTGRELIDTFCSALNLPRPRVRVPYFAGWSLAMGTELACWMIGREPPISRRTLEFFRTNNAFDIARARQTLGFRPRVSLHEGLAATRRWLAMKEVWRESPCAASQVSPGPVSR